MGLFDKFKTKVEKQVLEENVDKKIEHKEEEYNPKLGDANRYENARSVNKPLAEKINNEALKLVKQTLSVLQELESNPNKANLHSESSGSRWNSHFLEDQITNIEKLYGTDYYNIDSLPGVPDEVPKLIKRIKSVQEKIKEIV